MRRSVSSPDETLRRELNIWRAAEYFWRPFRCFIWWWNTASSAWCYFSNKMILKGGIKDAKMSSFFIWFPNTYLTVISLGCSELLMSLRSNEYPWIKNFADDHYRYNEMWWTFMKFNYIHAGALPHISYFLKSNRPIRLTQCCTMLYPIQISGG